MKKNTIKSISYGLQKICNQNVTRNPRKRKSPRHGSGGLESSNIRNGAMVP